MRAKVGTIPPYLKTLFESLDTSTKVIVFAHHVMLLDAITKCMVDEGIDHIRIDGKTPMKNRAGMLHRFEHDDSCRVGVLSLQACSTGLNMAFVSLVLYAEVTFGYIHMTQSVARAHRIGSTSPTLVQYLVLEGSTDKLVLSSHARKERVEGKLLDGEDYKAQPAAVVAFSSDQPTSTVTGKRKRELPPVVNEETEAEDETSDVELVM
jgi:SWI/SNF-related matrix-associated actin-dependent regulator 1 of chromatin subfamily A